MTTTLPADKVIDAICGALVEIDKKRAEEQARVMQKYLGKRRWIFWRWDEASIKESANIDGYDTPGNQWINAGCRGALKERKLREMLRLACTSLSYGNSEVTVTREDHELFFNFL